MKSLNSTNKNTLLSLGLLFCLNTQISTVMAEDHDHANMKPPHCEQGPHKPEGMMGMPPYLNGLDLTDVQQDKIFAITYQQMPKFRENAKQHHETMEALHQLASIEPYDDVKAQTLASTLAGLEKESILMRVRTDAKIHALLTVEQKQKLKTFAENFKGKRPPMSLPFSPIHSKQQYTNPKQNM